MPEVRSGEQQQCKFAVTCIVLIEQLRWYLLCKALRVLHTVCERLGEEVAAAFTQSIMVPAFLAGLGQQSEPHLGHGVTAGLLPERVVHTEEGQKNTKGHKV